MQLVERHKITKDKALEAICHKSGLLYNIANYYMRHSFFGKIQKFSEYELTGLFAEFDQPDYRELPAWTSQQVIKLLFKNWKSYFKSLKEWKKNPSKFTGKPKYPKYKEGKKLNVVIFTKSQIKIKNGYIKFPKKSGIATLKTKCSNFDQVRIVPQANCFVIEVVYEVEQIKNDLNENNFLVTDIGLNNLTTSMDNVGNKPFIINGKPLKSINQFYNKQKAILQSYVGDKGTSNRISKLTHKRNCKVEDFLHKASRLYVNNCIENKVATIVIGKNEQWKDEINIGSKNNQNFVSIPHAKFIDMIKYKAEMNGIKVILQEESYTSKCDHLAGEEIKKHETYLGKRKKRGLFQSSTKKLINADVNGLIGIALKSKVADNSFVKEIVSRGLAFNPVKLNII